MDIRTELKSLKCINRRFYFGSVFMHETIEATSWLIRPLMCYGPSYQLFVVSKLSSVCHTTEGMQFE